MEDPSQSTPPARGISDAGPGRRERKKLATRQALRSAALRLVAEHGLHHVTVEDIAEAADVSVRTFFNHFPSKEDAVIGLDPGQADRFTEALAKRPAEEAPLSALHGVLAELAGRISEGEDDWLLRMEVVRSIPELAPRLLASFAAYERALVEGVARRTGADPQTDLYPLCAALTAIAAFRSAIMSWCGRGQDGPLAPLVDDAFAIVAGGCEAPGNDGTRLRGSQFATSAQTRGRPCPHP